MGKRVYLGASTRTRREPIIYSCPCGERFRTDAYVAVDSGDAALAAELVDGALNIARCPVCRAEAEIAVAVVYHHLGDNQAAPRALLLLPDSLRHRELGERAAYFERLAKDGEPPVDYVLTPELLFGSGALKRTLGRVALPSQAAHELSAQTSQHDALDLRASLIESWIAGRQGPAAFVADDAVLVCAALESPHLEAFLAGAPVVRIGIERMPTHPLITLTLRSGGVGNRSLTLIFDVTRTAHRTLLESLGRAGSVMLELYDSQYLPVRAQSVRPEEGAGFEEHMRELLREAKSALEAIAPAKRDFAEARSRYAHAEPRRPSRANLSVADLRTRGSAELVALFERKESRREAALVLCERRDPSTLPALFSILRRMPRGEANLVLPAITAFGAAAESGLIEGLNSKKSYIRQGCALALGELKSPLGIDALVRHLLFEPTEIWTEVARAIGDVGPGGVRPLVGKLRDVDDDRRDRIVEALAHIVARGVRAPVEALIKSRDPELVQVARRALGSAREIKTADDALRQSTGGEHTVVRGFSRRFYEALGGNAIELDPGELEEIDELPDDEAEREFLTSPHTEPSVSRTQARAGRSAGENTARNPKPSLPR